MDMDSLKAIKRDIKLIYIYTFLSTFVLFYVCDTLFYIQRGVSSSGYILFIVISFFVQVVLEIPSGTFADKYSKKKILFVSNMLFVLSTVIFIFSRSYSMFVVATIIKAIDNSLVTGIANSMLYDILPDKSKFNRNLFFKSFSYNISYMIAMILGGYIGQKFGLVTTYYLSLIPSIINFIIIMKLKTVNRTVSNSERIISKLDIFKNAINEIKREPMIINLILTSSIVFSIIKLVEESHPNYSSDIGISVFWIGIYTSFILITCIIGSYIGSKIKSRYHKLIILINPIIIGLCIFIMGMLDSKIGIIFLLLIYIFSESFENIKLTKIHSNISSKSRVTVESIMSMIFCICGIVFGIVMSLILNFMKVYEAYIYLGIVIIIYGLFNLIKNNKLIF